MFHRPLLVCASDADPTASLALCRALAPHATDVPVLAEGRAPLDALGAFLAAQKDDADARIDLVVFGPIGAANAEIIASLAHEASVRHRVATLCGELRPNPSPTALRFLCPYDGTAAGRAPFRVFLRDHCDEHDVATLLSLGPPEPGPMVGQANLDEVIGVRARVAFETFEGGWLKSTELRMPELQPPPTGIGTSERWIDVDTKEQTLVAYVGPRPVYATLVSTGKGKRGTEQSTPVGTHRVWIKLIQSDMDNLDTAEAKSVYAVEAVPHVMFFEGGYGIHGTYWHDEFGVPKSHGCVNVSPTDARWLFQFVGPHLPVGWSAVFPTAAEPGTVIRIR